MSNKVWIYDVETLNNVFTYSAIDRDSDEIISFVIWKNRNDLQKLLKHLNECAGQIGFNNLAFDYPIIHFILKNKKKFTKWDGEQIAQAIYQEAQNLIGQKWSQIRQPWIPQLDLFTIHHFSNPARMTSLKKLEIALGFENVQDMPYHHNEVITEDSQIDEILDYNINDIKATKKFYVLSISKIELRKGLLSKYGLSCLNYSDSKIGEELMLMLYAKATNKNPLDIKKWRTTRASFRFAECIPSYVNFETKEFNELLDYLKSIEVLELKGSFDFQFTYRGIEFFLGTGGIHACIKEGVYESDEDNIIVDCDVAGMYPSIAKVNRFYPKHLGEEFCDVYENEIINPRLEAKEFAKNKEGKLTDAEVKIYKVLADGFKLSGNSVYGKSNSEYSFLYDPLYTLKTTLTGQLSLCMLSEMLFVGIPKLTMLQANTDGITVIIPREDQKKYLEICQEWERITKLELEYVAYKKMIIRDVNNYIAVSIDKKTKEEKVKYKGAFKPHKEMLKDNEYYKAFNQGIVPIALSEYFLNGKDVEETIMNHTNIYDFCKTFNATHGWKCESVIIDDEGNESDIKEEQKTNRYYISKNGKTFRKKKDVRKIDIEANDLVKIFNQYVELPFDQYDIDYDYYIYECHKIIDTITGEKERAIREKREQRERERLQREERNFIQFCINKIPTTIQFQQYSRPWLIEKYGIPKEIKQSRKLKPIDENQQSLFAELG